MLVELQLRDFALADRVVFEPPSGLVAVTGETGSGKSLLVNALGFVTGQRAQNEFVRSGASRCEVSAAFRVTHPELFREWLDGTDPLLVLRRELSVEGKSRAWINDRPVPLAALKRAGQELCDLHGQNQHQGLLDPESHAHFLDSFLTGSARDDYERAFDAWTACREALRTHREKLQSALSQKDFWEFQRGELERVNPRTGEYEELEAQRARLKAGEQQAQLLQGLQLELTDDDAGLLPRLRRLLAKHESRDDAPWVSHLKAALVSLEEAERAIFPGRWTNESEEESLEEIERRLHALYGLKKKFGGSLETAVAQREVLAANLKYLEDAEHETLRLERAEREAGSHLRTCGEVFSEARRKAEARMRKLIAGPLADLGLGQDPVHVRQEALDFVAWTRGGPHRVELLLAANPGEAPKALARIASGGELSRIMLALKSTAPGPVTVDTLVFDEIDAGIGGRTAARVGEHLKKLASGRQVIVITHLHQIASQADRHFEVSKVARDGRHVPEIQELSAAHRQEALARLIALDPPEEAKGRAASGKLRLGRRD